MSPPRSPRDPPLGSDACGESLTAGAARSGFRRLTTRPREPPDPETPSRPLHPQIIMAEQDSASAMIIGLTFKAMIEEGVWAEFAKLVAHRVKVCHDVELPENFAQLGVDKCTHVLLELLEAPDAIKIVQYIESLFEEEQDSSEYCSASTDVSDDEAETGPIMPEDAARKEAEAHDNPAFEAEEENGDMEDDAAAQVGSDPEDPSSDQSEERESSSESTETPDVAVGGNWGEDHDRDVNEKPKSMYGICMADAEPNIRTHLNRQAMMLKGALKEIDESGETFKLSVSDIQLMLERFIFNPPSGTPAEHAEVRYNFYPPFMHPKTICNYHIFSTTAPIPMSCKANRYGTEIMKKTVNLSTFRRLPKWNIGVSIDDDLGDEVSPVGELEEGVKMVPLEGDISRLQWAKSRGAHIMYFSYPSLHAPPKIVKMLMETLIQPMANEGDRDNCEPCVSDEEIAAMVDPNGSMDVPDRHAAIEKRRSMVSMAIKHCFEMHLMERLFREPSMVKKLQEVLHHTLHHGFVQVIREVAKVNLSNYVTFHGTTYNNLLNNCIQGQLFEGVDKEDFVVDSVYLALVLTWQTGMGMWQQAITDDTVKMYADYFERNKRRIYAMSSVNDMANEIIDALMDGDRLTQEMRKALPNFICLSQISSFRQFLMERSNIPSTAAPFYPSDFIPLCFKQCSPRLWQHCYLLQVAYFITNHGGYLWEPDSASSLSRAYCPCNLCSPHRMPQDNVALHNEMEAIGTFEIQNAEGKSFKLTPELWTNAYLDKFMPQDYHPFEVHFFKEHPDNFVPNMTACVTSSPQIFTLIRQIKENREEFLLNKGKGVYKDPASGETISHAPKQATEQAGFANKAVSANTSRHSRFGENSVGRQDIQDGSVYAQPQDKGSGGRRTFHHNDSIRRGGHRRRVPRKSGYGIRGRGGRGGDRATATAPTKETQGELSTRL